MLGLTGSRTPADLDQLFGGYHGYAEGMLNNLVPSAEARGYRTPEERKLDRAVANRKEQLMRDARRAQAEAARRSPPTVPPGGGMIDGTMYPNRTPRQNRHGGGGVRG
jgi:hypothetical protein